MNNLNGLHFNPFQEIRSFNLEDRLCTWVFYDPSLELKENCELKWRGVKYGLLALGTFHLVRGTLKSLHQRDVKQLKIPFCKAALCFYLYLIVMLWQDFSCQSSASPRETKPSQLPVFPVRVRILKYDR